MQQILGKVTVQLLTHLSRSVKRARPEKKQPSINGPPTTSDGCSALQGSPPLKGLPQEAGDVFIEKEVAASKKVEGKNGWGVAVDAGSSTSAESDELLVTAASAPTHSLLDLLADQALAQEQHLVVSQELLAAAVAKYKRSIQHRSLAVDTKSPPLPPPPPHSSPVGFPVNGVCQVVLPQLLQIGDFARHMDAGQVQIISNDADITIQ